MTSGNRKVLCVAGIIVGGLLSLAPSVGLAGTVLGMMRAFSMLQATGVADPQQLADAIGQVLLFAAVGAVVFLPGVALLITSIVLLNRAARAGEPARILGAHP